LEMLRNAVRRSLPRLMPQALTSAALANPRATHSQAFGPRAAPAIATKVCVPTRTHPAYSDRSSRTESLLNFALDLYQMGIGAPRRFSSQEPVIVTEPFEWVQVEDTKTGGVYWWCEEVRAAFRSVAIGSPDEYGGTD
jgi:hypothetical protein